VKPYPSVALGIAELTPLEVAEAYTIFPNRGTVKKLRSIINITSGEEVATEGRSRPERRASRRPRFSSRT
jgi:membrane carboxypeptidase/penicillin-binding protein